MTGYATYNARPPVLSPREEEAMALRLMARSLREASGKLERNRALNANHRIWSAIFRELNGSNCPLPTVLRQDLLRLAVWSMNYSTRAVLSNLPLVPLADMNATVAEGLETQPKRHAPVVPSAVSHAPASAPAPAWV